MSNLSLRGGFRDGFAGNAGPGFGSIAKAIFGIPSQINTLSNSDHLPSSILYSIG